jgi:hypothetical protein
MENILLFIATLSLGATFGFFIAVLLMGAKIADRNHEILYKELAKDEYYTESRGRRKEANTNSKDTELM